MRRRRNAKIIATLGPRTSKRKEIAALFEAGADVFRLNFSHGTHSDHENLIKQIRALEKVYSRPIGIIADLQGPKLRVGNFINGSIHLKKGDRFRLDLSEEEGTVERAPLPHPEVFEALTPGTDLLIDDGRIRLEVVECGQTFAETKVLTGGDISDHKGVNVPSVMLKLSPLTKKDRKDLNFALDHNVDYIALSFVQRPEDITEARALIGDKAAILVKLEKPTAIEHLYEIIDMSDAVMVARGDLGVEVPPEDVPALQRRIIRACRYAGRPVVVATQMLDSMVHSPTPTRAEASDVATAIYDGSDAVMLSQETAVGEYPYESVAMMERIIQRVECDPQYTKMMEATRREPEATSADAITAAARQVAHTLSAAAIVTYSSTGSTTRRAARERPQMPILGLTSEEKTSRQLALVWGVHSVRTKDPGGFTQMVNKAIRIALKEEFATSGDRLVMTAGVPFGTPGATNILRIAKIE